MPVENRPFASEKLSNFTPDEEHTFSADPEGQEADGRGRRHCCPLERATAGVELCMHVVLALGAYEIRRFRRKGARSGWLRRWAE